MVFLFFVNIISDINKNNPEYLKYSGLFVFVQ